MEEKTTEEVLEIATKWLADQRSTAECQKLKRMVDTNISSIKTLGALYDFACNRVRKPMALIAWLEGALERERGAD